MARHYEKAAQELLRAIRGKRSQIAFARRLGYRSNPITDWENGRRFPAITEVLRAARLAKLPVGAAFQAFSPISPIDQCAFYEISDWLNRLRGTRPLAGLALAAEKSRSSVSRWLSGKTEPRLPDFLRLLDAITGRVHDWVQALVGVEKVPTLYGRYAQVQAARRLAWERPWSEAVLRILETQSYKNLKEHHHQNIADRLKISEQEVKELLAELVEAGIIDKKLKLYQVRENLTVDTSSPSEELRAVREHWAQVSLERLKGSPEKTNAQAAAPLRTENEPKDWFAYNVLAVSKEDSQRIEARLRAAYREVRSIVAESEPADVAALLTMQIIRW